MRRLFVGIGISPALQTEVGEWEQEFTKKIPARWIAVRNLHLTLVPPWYAESVDDVRALMKDAIDIPSFDLRFVSVLFGPNPRSPRLVWAQGRAPGEMVHLKAALEKRLKIKSEKRPLFLHLTLARFRPEQFSSFPLKRLHERIEWNMRAESFRLYESHLTPEGAEYETLAEFDLVNENDL